MFHIVYLAFESGSGGRNYIGKHSTENLNDGYLGSFSDDSFNPDSKIILGYFKNAKDAVKAEIQWQRTFDVASSPEFANRAVQRSAGFDTTGYRFSLKHKRVMPAKKLEERLLHSKRMTENNPMWRPEVARKAVESRRPYTGSDNPNAKLSSVAREVVRLLRPHFKKPVLALVFGVSTSTIKRIK